MAALFVILVTATGGGSRSDIQSLVFLRPAAVLFLAFALYLCTREQLRSVAIPFAIVSGVAIIAVLQLIPLPPSAWTALPQRETISQIEDLLGITAHWRPLTLDPAGTWNTLFSLAIPLATIALCAMLNPRRQGAMIGLVILAAIASTTFGILQAIGLRFLQFYDIAHYGFPAGLFANKNHQSVMLVWLMTAVSWAATTGFFGRVSPRASVATALGSILVLFPLVVLAGSRAGLALSVPAIIISAWLLSRTSAVRDILKRSRRRSRVTLAIGAGILLVPILAVFAILAFSQRNTALSRVLAADVTADARVQFLPQMRAMAVDFLPFGSGLGSFEAAFGLYEPAATLSSRYLNEAHNDFLQVLIEAGIPGVLLLGFGLVWLVLRVVRLWRTGKKAEINLAIFIAGSIVLWGMASIVDYPLRTPLAAMIVAVLTAQLAASSTRQPFAAPGQERTVSSDAARSSPHLTHKDSTDVS
ncbi:O-antigen ligase family protein [Qipengyuania sp. XHP0207]|uniref:O-antigen ligase family protein n=1 Tax=Qipengyuania sp. XHP0207 TaxID=3038078 RepID=UPI00241DD083|nr:O-antigen ligase family protein [Qipengyuania sp. XHP0207]MDG5747269.1 O-antigen ligase family protein [Qipengyuania sp. XHP0207]